MRQNQTTKLDVQCDLHDKVVCNMDDKATPDCSFGTMGETACKRNCCNQSNTHAKQLVRNKMGTPLTQISRQLVRTIERGMRQNKSARTTQRKQSNTRGNLFPYSGKRCKPPLFVDGNLYAQGSQIILIGRKVPTEQHETCLCVRGRVGISSSTKQNLPPMV